MGGVVLHQNREQRAATLHRIEVYYEKIEGKRAILQTWEQVVINPTEEDIHYMDELRVKIRRNRVLLSHIRP